MHLHLNVVFAESFRLSNIAAENKEAVLCGSMPRYEAVKTTAIRRHSIIRSQKNFVKNSTAEP